MLWWLSVLAILLLDHFVNFPDQLQQSFADTLTVVSHVPPLTWHLTRDSSGTGSFIERYRRQSV